MTDQSLRKAVEGLRADLNQAYPDRAQYDIPSTVIDRLDAMLAASGPTQDQIAEAIHNNDMVHAWQSGSCGIYCRYAYPKRAEAVLTLLNGKSDG